MAVVHEPYAAFLLKKRGKKLRLVEIESLEDWDQLGSRGCDLPVLESRSFVLLVACVRAAALENK